jgi:hypothetical protein
MAKSHTKFLLTEGKDDAFAIASLMSHYVTPWGHREEQWPVKIEAAGSVTELLNAVYISSWFKRAGLEAIGILLDADEDFEGRWASIRRTCLPLFDDLPTDIPSEGLISIKAGAPRLGVWIMPDNGSAGMLETFLTYLVPDSNRQVWEHAIESCERARDMGAPFRQPHLDKAHIHTWLAWQDPPGDPFGVAIKSKCLNPDCPAATSFAHWFLDLYQLRDEVERAKNQAE